MKKIALMGLVFDCRKNVCAWLCRHRRPCRRPRVCKVLACHIMLSQAMFSGFWPNEGRVVLAGSPTARTEGSSSPGCVLPAATARAT